MKIIELNKADFLKNVTDYESNPTEWKYLGDKPAIIDFYADWCGPCRMLTPILEELAEEYKDSIYIYKVNTENEKDVAAVFNIKSIPTLIYAPVNDIPQLTQGVLPKKEIVRLIDEILLKK